MLKGKQDVAKKMIADLRPGEPVDEVFLLSGFELRTARNESLYLDLTLSDRSGTLKGRMWDASEVLYRALAVDDFVRIKGRVGVFRNELQINVSSISKVDETRLSPHDFLPQSERPPGEMRKELEKILVNEVKDPDYARLVRAFLRDEEFMDQFSMAPAATSYHHAFLGGLLEHTLSMAQCALLLVGHYSCLRKDLLLASVFLHDIGKVRELDWRRTFQYTDTGQLVGHVVEGVVMVEAKVRDLEGFPQEKLDLLRHAIIAHHGEYEFGAPKLPMTGEALALHYLDNLDAKLRDITDAIAADANEQSNWTGYITRLERRLYKR